MNEPSPFKCSITKGQGELEILIPKLSPGGFWAIAAIGYWGGVLPGLLCLILIEEGYGKILGITLIAAGLLMIAAPFINGSTLICLGPESIDFTQRMFGFSRTEKMSLRHVTNLRAFVTYSDEYGFQSTGPGISLDYGGTEYRVAWGFSEEEAKYLVNQIAEQYPNVNLLDPPK